MDSMNGWICLHRRFLKWEWYDDSNVMRVFIHLLLSCNHEPRKWRGMVINNGQLFISNKSLKKDLKLSPQKIRTCLEKLCKTKEIVKKSTNHGTLITIVKYELYQSYGGWEQQTDNKRITNEQQTDNNQQQVNHLEYIYIYIKEKERKYKKKEREKLSTGLSTLGENGLVFLTSEEHSSLLEKFGTELFEYLVEKCNDWKYSILVSQNKSKLYQLEVDDYNHLKQWGRRMQENNYKLRTSERRNTQKTAVVKDNHLNNRKTIRRSVEKWDLEMEIASKQITEFNRYLEINYNSKPDDFKNSLRNQAISAIEEEYGLKYNAKLVQFVEFNISAKIYDLLKAQDQTHA